MAKLSEFSRFLAVGAVVALSGCAGSIEESGLPTGGAAYQAIDADVVPAPVVYQIQAADTLQLRVFGEPDISAELMRVDDAGFLQVPLVGQIKADGRGTLDVQNEIREKLAASYLVDPKVTLSVIEPAPRYVSVEGDVGKPGVYEMTSKMTLLAALARAESTTETSKLSTVVIQRTVNGQKMAGRFDLPAIRGGLAPDPVIMDHDVIVVGTSGTRVFVKVLERVLAPVTTGVFYMLR
ncbi:polysaccharide biosynthesis/export family protein [Novosphingobium sp. MBES04]|uniref:polysaccharide biosynthesis/export family protein n=1 Tax=Novosphingobium sp. MBES04 TaxID=1206458 RepID=UPI000694281C|nr:polysaccharide biosynthesis/export family protein [Novosphingobium sp. MBES04]